jgi:sulfatase maturation enzyme AslB (radical SAM superfamily)
LARPPGRVAGIYNHMEQVKIFGKPVQLKTHYCSLLGQDHLRVEDPYVNLYVRTKHCNARCAFCTYHSDASKWDERRYLEVLREITSKIRIAKVAFSGGEPTLYWDNFKSCFYDLQWHQIGQLRGQVGWWRARSGYPGSRGSSEGKDTAF